MTDREESLSEYPDTLTGAEVAAILRLDPRSVSRRAERGELPAWRAGSGPRAEWRFERRRIVALIEGRSPWEEMPPPLADLPLVLTAQEVGAVLRYEPATVAQMAAAGLLEGFKASVSPRAQWRFHKPKIVRLIEARQPPPPAEPAPPAP